MLRGPWVSAIQDISSAFPLEHRLRNSVQIASPIPGEFDYSLVKSRMSVQLELILFEPLTMPVILQPEQNHTTLYSILHVNRKPCCIRKEGVGPVVMAAKVIRPVQTYETNKKISECRNILVLLISEIWLSSSSDNGRASVLLQSPVNHSEVLGMMIQPDSLHA